MWNTVGDNLSSEAHRKRDCNAREEQTSLLTRVSAALRGNEWSEPFRLTPFIAKINRAGWRAQRASLRDSKRAPTNVL